MDKDVIGGTCSQIHSTVHGTYSSTDSACCLVSLLLTALLMASRGHPALCEEESGLGWEKGKAVPNKLEEQRSKG